MPSTRSQSPTSRARKNLSPTRRRASTRELAWWAITGSERCPACLMAYHVEAEVRCAACDGAFCPDCAATHLVVEGELVCADCARDASEER